MIIGKEKLFQNGCRMRYCVATILLQNSEPFLGDGFEELESQEKNVDEQKE